MNLIAEMNRAIGLALQTRFTRPGAAMAETLADVNRIRAKAHCYMMACEHHNIPALLDRVACGLTTEADAEVLRELLGVEVE